MKIAIQGYSGSFHHIVADKYFGHGVEILPCATFREVAAHTECGDADFGIMAIENSIAGSILPNYNILQNSSLLIHAEAYLHIRQNLMAMPGVTTDQITEVRTHPMAILQCIDYLDNHRWKLIETEDTALSAAQIAAGSDRHAAAIASELAAELFGLEIIAPAINTIPDNQTRFVILGLPQKEMCRTADKASLYFKVDHSQGALLHVLQEIDQAQVNLSKLQSYPIPNEPWHYMFHVDMEFDSPSKFEKALTGITKASRQVHVYGTYKKGINLDPR